MSETSADDSGARRIVKMRRSTLGDPHRDAPAAPSVERDRERTKLAKFVLDLVVDEVVQRLKRRLRTRGATGAAAFLARPRLRRRRAGTPGEGGAAG
ncbi:hypothetical protein, partial [Rhodovulum sp. PH10]|uniref:hypothetical protein n=1 Tax=Rhodovulum sp. PH10 TaxID=1187851 RepID=UPI0012FA654F